MNDLIKHASNPGQVRLMYLGIALYHLVFVLNALQRASDALYGGKSWEGFWIWAVGAAVMVVVLLAARQTITQAIQETSTAEKLNYARSTPSYVWLILAGIATLWVGTGPLNWPDILGSRNASDWMRSTMRALFALLAVVDALYCREAMREYRRSRAHAVPDGAA